MVPIRVEPPSAPEAQRAHDDAQLRALGYVPQLLRDMGGLHNFALSFSVISVLTGGITLYGHGLRFGGPLTMSVGWPLVLVLTLPIAASLAQLASSFPTAGALYHWSSILGGRGWGFLTAWLNIIGQFAITAGIDYGLAEFIAAALGRSADRAQVLAIYAALLVSHGVINHVGVRTVSSLNTVSAVYHIVVVGLLVAAILVWAPLRSPSFLFQRYVHGPYSFGYAFAIGLLQAQWTFTGYDASAHVTEETVDPTRNAPWGIFLSVLVSGVVGYAMLTVVTLAIGDLPATAAADNPFVAIVRTRVGGAAGSALVWLVVGAMWFCGLASVTSNSRMLFAFARDGGLPAARRLATVSPRYQTPAAAVWLSIVAAFVVAVWASAYAAVVALSTLALYASYAVPIAVGLHARRKGRWRTLGPWNLGRHGTWINVLALVWSAVIMVLFVLPPNALAGYTFYGMLALLGVYWFAWARQNFRGPQLARAASAGAERDG